VPRQCWSSGPIHKNPPEIKHFSLCWEGSGSWSRRAAFINMVAPFRRVEPRLRRAGTENYEAIVNEVFATAQETMSWAEHRSVTGAGDPIAMRDLQRLCIMCDRKKQCRHELARGTAAETTTTFVRTNLPLPGAEQIA
jgi:hypothetical protein